MPARTLLATALIVISAVSHADTPNHALETIVAEGMYWQSYSQLCEGNRRQMSSVIESMVEYDLGEPEDYDHAWLYFHDRCQPRRLIEELSAEALERLDQRQLEATARWLGSDAGGELTAAIVTASHPDSESLIEQQAESLLATPEIRDTVSYAIDALNIMAAAEAVDQAMWAQMIEDVPADHPEYAKRVEKLREMQNSQWKEYSPHIRLHFESLYAFAWQTVSNSSIEALKTFLSVPEQREALQAIIAIQLAQGNRLSLELMRSTYGATDSATSAEGGSCGTGNTDITADWQLTE